MANNAEGQAEESTRWKNAAKQFINRITSGYGREPIWFAVQRKIE